MVEKKLVVDGLRFTYSGSFGIMEFFNELNNWVDENGFEIEIKKKMQHVYEDHKMMDYIFELWKPASSFARHTVRVRAMFKDVEDFQIQRGEFLRNLQKGHVLVIIDGFVELDVHRRWQQKPLYVFTRTLFEKYVWKWQLGRYDGPLANYSYGIYNRLHGYFKKYKY